MSFLFRENTSGRWKKRLLQPVEDQRVEPSERPTTYLRVKLNHWGSLNPEQPGDLSSELANVPEIIQGTNYQGLHPRVEEQAWSPSWGSDDGLPGQDDE